MYDGMGGGGNAWMKIMGIGDGQRGKKGKGKKGKTDKDDEIIPG